MNGLLSSATVSTAPLREGAWVGPGAAESGSRLRRWGQFLRSMVLPPKGHRVVPTKSGLMLIVLALGIGMAAYSTSSNILFTTLALLLSTLILSGIISWFNFKGTCWRLVAQPPFRVNQEAVVALDVANRKRFLPTYSLWFDFRLREAGQNLRIHLSDRLDSGQTTRLEWTFRPASRGVEQVEMYDVGSQFPFGFLKKHLGGIAAMTVRIWPERIPYTFDGSHTSVARFRGQMARRSGGAGDLISLRKYQPGDSHRQIHWKATARSRKLMIRQLAAENHGGFYIFLDPSEGIWKSGPQFETLCSLTASLAEDLFRENLLLGAAVCGEPMVAVRRLADLEAFLDRLAVLEPMAETGRGDPPPFRHVITFQPSSTRGVHAYIGSQKAATA
ncbi:MAG: DUF58 domain-containing protein [Puniceicoccaceae bacterium]|nr:MAG: DUF58 domain-containing protein [Puniceicoccaceae bacterium]